MRELVSINKITNYVSGSYVNDAVRMLATGKGVKDEAVKAFNHKPYETYDNSKIKVRRRLNNEQ